MTVQTLILYSYSLKTGHSELKSEYFEEMLKVFWANCSSFHYLDWRLLCLFSLFFIDPLNVCLAPVWHWFYAWNVCYLEVFICYFPASRFINLCMNLCVSVLWFFCLSIQSWVDRAGRQALLSDTLDLAELFNPDTFLNALRQETAR